MSLFVRFTDFTNFIPNGFISSVSISAWKCSIFVQVAGIKEDLMYVIVMTSYLITEEICLVWFGHCCLFIQQTFLLYCLYTLTDV